MNELARMTAVKKSYDGKKQVLSGLDFSISLGETALIHGTSGCGKSTFLNIVGLLDSYSDGEYTFNGIPIIPKKLNSYYKQRAMDIGFVFQNYSLIDSISVRENILMPYLYNNQYIDKTVMINMDKLLEEFNIAELKNTKTSLLSGGERQRVAIIRAMIKNPKLIIADEPTGNLDETNSRLVFNAFKKIAERGTAVVAVTHNKYLSLGLGRTYTLEEGELRLC
ncbi:MAG: ABC transporter ATP-binding protein [Oscillospiraceae bacterium]|nr:ABC transporter ATP-binding protein [Oscillospiraceae bacterium]